MAEVGVALSPHVATSVDSLGLLPLLERDGVVISEGSADPLSELLVGDVHTDHDHALWGEVVEHVAPHSLGSEVGDATFAGSSAEAQGVVAESRLVDKLADHSCRVGRQGRGTLLHLLLGSLDLPREESGKKDIADHQGHHKGHEFSQDINVVGDVLTSGLARGRRVGAELLEGLHSSEVAQVRSGGVAHHGDHVGHTEVAGVLESAAGIHHESEPGSESLLVDGHDLQAVLELGGLDLGGGQDRGRSVQEDGSIQGHFLVGVGGSLLNFVEVELGQFCHDLLDVLFLELDGCELHGRHGAGLSGSASHGGQACHGPVSAHHPFEGGAEGTLDKDIE
mmetsp:Transcript_50594/g.109178  ORF Transcript_50594/g.109178 Transcript_50594/m.109178 type:complete len:337 (-) Transcript_50594:63-1073(-)